LNFLSRPALQKQYDYHVQVINQCDWPRFEKEKIKKRIYKVLKKDGYVDLRAFEPNYRWNVCSIRLQNGDFTNWDGWQFRSPWFMTFMGLHGEKCPVPKWDGRPVEHLVVLGEQGLGDEILFLSALPELMVRFGKGIEWVGYEQLNSIVERSFKTQTSGRRLLSEVTEGDAVMASGDLFQWYRRDKCHFPRKPFLKPDPERVEHWKQWLKDFGDRPKIGLGWYSRHGSVDPKDLLVEDAVYFDLQYYKDGLDIPKRPENVIACPFDFSESFEDLFAFVSCLDKVFSTTQTLVHICGSIGKECHAIQPPKNGEVKFPLWYSACKILGNDKVWPHLVYANVTVYESIQVFRDTIRKL
jgi:hypothetical protein